MVFSPEMPALLSQSRPNLGKYYCLHIVVSNVQVCYRVTALEELLALTHFHFAIEGHEYAIPVAGLYNIYNALAGL